MKSLDALTAELTAELAAMHDPADSPGTWTARERDAYEMRRRHLVDRLHLIREATATLADLAPRIVAAEQWQTHLNTWRPTLCEELLALPARDPRTRNLELSLRVLDHGMGWMQSSGYSLSTLRLGALMRESGFQPVPVPNQVFGELPWYGSLAEVEHQLTTLTRRREAAQAALKEAQLSDDERAHREAASDEMRATYNAMNVRLDAEGKTLVAYGTDGEVLTTSKLTAAQRKAMEWAAKAMVSG